MKICFLTKIEKPGVREAIEFTEDFTKDIDVFSGNIDDNLPEEVKKRKYDVIISYISPWIIPKSILEKTYLNFIKFFITIYVNQKRVGIITEIVITAELQSTLKKKSKTTFRKNTKETKVKLFRCRSWQC